MKTDVMMKAGRLLARVGLQLKKHSPEICMVAGIAGGITSAVMACKATTKVDQILEPAKETIEIVHKGMEEGQINGTEYTVEDGQKDLSIVYIQTGVKLAKLYGPSIALGAASIVSIVAGHKILKGRNIALAAAYTAIDKGFKDYRKNVVDRFGKEIDKELRYNIKAKEVEVKTMDENGIESTEKKIVNVPHEGPSDFARFFDEACFSWTKDPETNLMFLRRQQDYANDKLRCRGHLFLNEVYDMLGIPRSTAGQSVGWIYDEEHPIGDNYVDFGIYDIDSERKRAFVNGFERSILLDFNVDGPIYNLIEKY